MSRLGFYYDQTRCTGCRTCQIMCKDVNNLQIGINYRQVKTYEQGEYPNPGYYHFSWSCNHCENPACVKSCPSGAMHIEEDGTVQPNDDLCIGCKYCVEACPYGAPKYNIQAAVTRKCTACILLRAEGLNPACVDACTMRCLDFGDMEELKLKYGEALVQDIAVLPNSIETTPSLLIKARYCALLDDFEQKFI